VALAGVPLVSGDRAGVSLRLQHLAKETRTFLAAAGGSIPDGHAR
jgi:hypothetical protein